MRVGFPFRRIGKLIEKFALLNASYFVPLFKCYDLISCLSLQQNSYRNIIVVVAVISWLLLNVEEEEEEPNSLGPLK